MREDEKKAATAAYKERKSVAGVYCVRCAASGEAWVGQCRDLDKISNRLWFTLRTGAHPIASLQQAYREHGPEAFAFETVESAPDDEPAFALDRFLKERVEHWRTALAARAI